jgi:predicted O-methyltransferase YrrM
MRIIKSDIKKIDLTSLVSKITREDHKTIFLAPPGQNHYGFLAYLSLQKDNQLIIELGTHHGTSSLAMSINPTNTIITYDIVDRYGIHPQPKNVETRIGDVFKLNQTELLLKADFIFLDTAHEGPFEWQVYNFLVENKYRGILILDDIHWNKPMKEFWNGITMTKYDVTDIGHGICPDGVAGTGIVDFSNKIFIS